MRKILFILAIIAAVTGWQYRDGIAQQVTRGAQVITGDLRVGGDIYGLGALDIGGTFTGVNATLTGRMTASSADIDSLIGALLISGRLTVTAADIDSLYNSLVITGTLSPAVFTVAEKTPVNAVIARDTLTSDETVPDATDTLKVGNVTYTFVDTLTVTYAVEDTTQATPLYTANEIIIGETYDVTLANIKLAINATDQDTTTYAPGTVANPLVLAGTVAAAVLPLAARTAGVAGNAIALVSENAHLVAASAVFTGGVDGTVGVANETCADATYLYHCTATNTISGANWRRVALGSVY
jgi:hypothetical protein